ncbi:Dscam3 isoform B, partial [Danaus plexippus plexippus]
EVGPPSDYFDLNMLVIICSSVLLVICLLAFICILLKRHRQNYSSYRHSMAEEVKSRDESVASHSEHKERYAHTPRIYTSPVHPRKTSKNEMFEISPYAEFALGFRTFDHVENQDLPSRLPSRPRFDTVVLNLPEGFCSFSDDYLYRRTVPYRVDGQCILE